MAEQYIEKIEIAYKNSKLPEMVNVKETEKILVEMRKALYN